MNRLDRLLGLILYLQSHPLSTAEEMAAHYCVSVRTIYRDLAALGEAGVPVVAQAGVGYVLGKDFQLAPLRFTPDELGALAAGGMLVTELADESLRSRMRSALMKVRAALPRSELAQIWRLEQRMTATARPRKPAQASLVIVQKALAEQRVLRIEYQGPGKSEAEEREIEPLALVHYLARWHLIAWCRSRQDYRDFRTDRIRRLSPQPERFEARPEFSVDGYLAAMPQPNLRARIRFLKGSADRARREWWQGIPEEDDEVLTLAAVDWDSLAMWLLSFGTSVEVLEPLDLRERLVELARQAVQHHAS